MSEIPAEVTALAHQRAEARAARDWAESDRLRELLSEAGYLVKDTAAGFELTLKPPFETQTFAQAFPDVPAGASVAGTVVTVVVDGWPEDALECLQSLNLHCDPSVSIVAVDCGNVEGAGVALQEFAKSQDQRRIEIIHLDQPLEILGWSKLRMALIHRFTQSRHVILDMSTVLDGDAITPLIEAMSEGVVASGWRGVWVNTDDNWRSFVDADSGEVDALLSYLMVVDRDAALATPLHPKAKFYRNADLEWGLALRAAGGKLVTPDQNLACHQTRHHGYHDSDPDMRDRESKKTYDRLLQAFRSKPEILVKRK